MYIDNSNRRVSDLRDTMRWYNVSSIYQDVLGRLETAQCWPIYLYWHILRQTK